MAISTPFIGRQHELAELRSWLREAVTEGGVAAIVSGDLGIGKTRLVDEFLALHAGQTLLGAGRWQESPEMPAYLGFKEALLPLLGDEKVRSVLAREGPRAYELSRLGPEYAEVLGCTTQGETDERYRLWRAIVMLLRASSALCPTVLSLDDVQCADKGSLELIGYLGGEVKDLPILIVATYREEDVRSDHPLNATIATLARAEVLRTMRLAGLTRSDVGELAAVMGVSHVAGGGLDALHRQTGGNPLFVTELVRDLLATPSPPDDLSWLEPGTSSIALPEGLRQVIAHRFTHTSAPCLDVLRLASVLGREFDVAVVELMSALARDQVLSAIDEAATAVVISPLTTGRFVFHHPLLRQVVYEAMEPAARLRGHLRAAEALQKFYGANAHHHARAIAHHLLAAGGLGTPGEVATVCLAGARQARVNFAFEEARDLLLGGLEATERLPQEADAVRVELLMELGYAQTALGLPADALETYREALARYEAAGDSAGWTDALRWIAATHARYGRWSDVLDVTVDALERADEGSTPAYVGLVGSHAMALIVSARSREAEPWVHKLLDLAFDDGTRAVANHVAAGYHGWGFGDHEQASSHFAAARDSFLRAGSDSTASGAALDQAVVSHLLGDWDRSYEALKDAERLAANTGRVAVLADVHAVRSMKAVQRGSWEEAHHERGEWRALTADIGGTTVYGTLAEHAEALEELLRRGPEAAQSTLVSDYPIPSAPLRALIHAAHGEFDTARRLVDSIAAVLPNDGRGLFWLLVALPTISALCALDDPSAQAWAPALARHPGSATVWSQTDIELGRIATIDGRWDEAEAQFVAAENSCRERGLRPFYAEALCNHARMLGKRLKRGDLARADALLAEACDVLAEIGLEYACDRARSLRHTRRRGRRAASGPGGLTAREITVLRLLGEGLSNRQMAERLVLSERTIEHHLAAIYAKLDVSSRSAAVARAMRTGLLPGADAAD